MLQLTSVSKTWMLCLHNRHQ